MENSSKHIEWRKKNSYWLQTSVDIANKILQALDEQNLTKDDLNRKTKISKIKINKMLNGKYDFSLKQLIKIEVALNINLICK